jgi:hypothetical protein
MDHPESLGMQAIEPSVGDLLRLKEFLDGVEKAGERELRELCRLMARSVFVSHPATVRWLSREAAAGLGSVHRQQVGETLVRKLREDAGLTPDVLDGDSAALEPEQ